MSNDGTYLPFTGLIWLKDGRCYPVYGEPSIRGDKYGQRSTVYATWKITPSYNGPFCLQFIDKIARVMRFSTPPPKEM